MNVLFRTSFERDLKKIRSKSTKAKIKKVILQIKAAKTTTDIPNLKKLQTHRHAFRIRIGEYRIGAFVDGYTFDLVRCLNRKKIYDVFP